MLRSLPSSGGVTSMVIVSAAVAPSALCRLIPNMMARLYATRVFRWKTPLPLHVTWGFHRPLHSGCWDSEFLDIFLNSVITLPSPECAIQQILLKIKGSLNYSHVHIYDVNPKSSFPRFLLHDVGCPCPLFRLKSTYATSEAARGIGTWTNAYETCEKDKDAKAFTLSLALNFHF